MLPPPNIGSLNVENNNYLYDLADELDGVRCSFNVLSYACSDVQSYVDKDEYVNFCISLKKSLDVLTNYMDVLVTELYRMCDY